MINPTETNVAVSPACKQLLVSKSTSQVEQMGLLRKGFVSQVTVA